MSIIDSETADLIQQVVCGVTGDLWQIPVTFQIPSGDIVVWGRIKEMSAEYAREQYGDEIKRVVSAKFEQQLWLSLGGDAVEEGQVALYGNVRFEVKGIVNTGMLKDRFLFIELDLVR